MTKEIKTVQNPRLILVLCENAERISEIISDILNNCSYNTCIDRFTENTDFIISGRICAAECSEDIIADTVVFDKYPNTVKDVVSKFKNRVTSYECCCGSHADESVPALTYSRDNYSADITCRNIGNQKGKTVFDIIGSGILGRIRMNSESYTVDEVLLCTAVLTVTGVPLASILNYFNSLDEK